MEDYYIPTVDSGLLDGGLLYSDGGLIIPTVDSGLLDGGLLYPDSGFWIRRWRTTISRQWILESSMEDYYIPTVDSGLLVGGLLREEQSS